VTMPGLAQDASVCRIDASNALLNRGDQLPATSIPAPTPRCLDSIHLFESRLAALCRDMQAVMMGHHGFRAGQLRGRSGAELA
jgi:hypothetical protein